MIINDEREKERSVDFIELRPGEIFIYNAVHFDVANICMKMVNSPGCENNVVALATGEQYWFEDDDKVTRLDGFLTLK